MLTLPLPSVNDTEGQRIPESLPFMVDAHVHLFPDVFFSAIRQWFDRFAWPIRYRLTSTEVIEFLLSRGVGHIVGLHYSHRPGMATFLNTHMAQLCSQYPQLTGTATVFPGEEGAGTILEDAFRQGLVGVKLHAHVQFFHLDSPEMNEIYQVCSTCNQPLVMHVGREPRNPDYPYDLDPHVICRGDILEEVIRNYPRLKVCVPHLGADEFTLYRRLLDRYDNLWTDTTMVLADYLPVEGMPPLEEYRHDRILFGTDFPNIPYAWDRELRHLCQMGLPENLLEQILGKNASHFFGIEEKPASERRRLSGSPR
jgi:uncharacterized protein